MSDVEREIEPATSELDELVSAGSKLILALRDYARYVGGKTIDEVGHEMHDLVMKPLANAAQPIEKLLMRRFDRENYAAEFCQAIGICQLARQVKAGTASEWHLREYLDRFFDPPDNEFIVGRYSSTYRGWQDPAAIFKAIHHLESRVRELFKLLGWNLAFDGALNCPWTSRNNNPSLPEGFIQDVESCVGVLEEELEEVRIAERECKASPNVQPDDELPAKHRKLAPSRIKAKAAYDWALSEIVGAEDMTIAELFEAIDCHPSNASQALPPNAEAWGKYLRDAGVKRYNTDQKQTGGSVHDADEI